MAGRSISARLGTLAEALLWAVGYHCCQGVALISVLALLITAAYGVTWPDLNGVMQLLLDLGLDRSFLLVGASSLGALFLILPTVRLRLGRDWRAALGTRIPRRDYAVFSLAMVIPIAVVGDAVYEIAQRGWAFLVEAVPELAVWSQLGAENLHGTFQGVPYPILVIAVALGPAIGEEIVFRGVIGRCLIARWGVPAGITVTSLLFAAAHVWPPHAVATIPIAVLLHVLYVRCGTLWVPILVHFGNNLLAVSMVRFDFVPALPASPLVVVWALAYLTALVALLNLNERILQKRAGLSAT